jgi:hypothetical protein
MEPKKPVPAVTKSGDTSCSDSSQRRSVPDATQQESVKPDKNPSKIQIISTVCSCITTLIAIVGLSSLILNFRTYSDAIQREEQRKSDDVLARLFTMDIDIKKTMVGYPKTREFLFEDPSGTKYLRLQADKAEDGKLINETRLFCGVYGNYFEYFLMHESYIQHPDKKDVLRKEWQAYLTFVCNNSYAFRNHLLRTKSSWSTEIIDVVEAAESRSRQ